MKDNPYDSPNTSSPKSSSPKRNSQNNISSIALATSCLGLSGLITLPVVVRNFTASHVFMLYCMALSLIACALGFLLGLIGAIHPPRRLAIWAAIIGLYGSMHIPTFAITFMHYLSK